MARSKRRTSVVGITTAVSEKQDKRIANIAERRINKALLAEDLDGSTLKSKRELSNVWAFDKDGKQRIDPQKYPKAMRK
jgi:hypothetical protein